jgi:hypothetical protein
MRQQAEKDIQIQEKSKVSIREIRMNREYYDKLKLKESKLRSKISNSFDSYQIKQKSPYFNNKSMSINDFPYLDNAIQRIKKSDSLTP